MALNIIGKWKYAAMTEKSGSDEWIPMEEFVRRYPSPTFAMLPDEIIEFREDGKMITSIDQKKLPENFAKDIPPEENTDEPFVIKKQKWEIRDGRLFTIVDSPLVAMGIVSGDPEEIEIRGENLILMGMAKLEKID